MKATGSSKKQRNPNRDTEGGMDNIYPKRMLVILARPEEHFATLSGMLARYARDGVQVILLCATCSESGDAGVVLEKTREVEEPKFKQTARELGLEVYSLGYSNASLTTVEPCMLLESITCWIDLVKPQLIITAGPEAACTDADEAVLARIVTRAYDECCRKGLLLYSRPSGEVGSSASFTIARGTRETENYPDWLEPELVERQISNGKA
jgi:LmbE family N-acetylglucosaminyl deacetylase